MNPYFVSSTEFANLKNYKNKNQMLTIFLYKSIIVISIIVFYVNKWQLIKTQIIIYYNECNSFAKTL